MSTTTMLLDCLATHAEGDDTYVHYEYLITWAARLVDTDGNVIQNTSYTPFGEVMESTGVPSKR